MKRRQVLGYGVASFALMLLTPLRALAAAWNRAAFEATRADVALQGLGVEQLAGSAEIELLAPDMADRVMKLLPAFPAQARTHEALSALPKPTIATPPWETLFADGANATAQGVP